MKKKKHSITLVEIMIVILLIGLIGGALTYNMRGSMDKGRAFKTEQNISRVYDALMMEYAKNESSLQTILNNKEHVLECCPFVKGGKALLKDGWGELLTFKIDKHSDDLVISSAKLEQWKQRHEQK